MLLRLMLRALTWEHATTMPPVLYIIMYVISYNIV